MQFEQIRYHFENTSSLRLLKYEHAAIALSFLGSAFKDQSRVQISHRELASQLDLFLTDLNERHGCAMKAPAVHYLDQWADDRHRFIRKYYELDHDEEVTELTYDTEQALEWIQGLERKEFVGAESRFFAIFAGLREIVSKADHDPKNHLKSLKLEREKIEDQMRTIAKTGTVQTYDEVQIKERFLNLMESARRLLADFRLIEEIFKDLTKKIKAEILTTTQSAGGILAQVLDIHDQLEESDQGKSFRAFWNFLMSPEKQEELKSLSHKVLEVSSIARMVQQSAYLGHARSLRNFKGQMLQVAHKVLQSQYRLSREIRKLLQARTLAETKRLNEEIFAIKRIFALHSNTIFSSGHAKMAISIDGPPKVTLPLERPLWRPKTAAKFTDRAGTLGDAAPGPKALPAELDLHSAMMQARELEKILADMLAGAPSVTLVDVTRHYPILHGCAEILAYMGIALNSSRHQVDPTISETISLREGGHCIQMPRVVFRRQIREEF